MQYFNDLAQNEIGMMKKSRKCKIYFKAIFIYNENCKRMESNLLFDYF